MILNIEPLPAGATAPERLDIPPDSALASDAVGEAGTLVLKVEDKVLIWSAAAGDGGRVVYKMYRFRGADTVLRGRLARFRAEREYLALAHLKRVGVACSEPVFWAHGRSADYGLHEILAMREIPGADPLRTLIRPGAVELDDSELLPLYEMVRTMHGSGLHHGALLPRNVLVTRDDGGRALFHIIDMPRALLFGRDIVGTRMAWFDLLDLSSHMAVCMGTECCRLLLGRYGMDELALARFLAELECYRPTRHTRNRLRGEFLIRQALARLL